MLNRQISKNSCELAFTLAEVLITLGIIGVVAAMTIPVLVKEANSIALKTAYKKAYSVASQAYNTSINENGGGFGGYTFSTTLSYTKYDAVKSKLKVIQSCDYGSGANGKCWPSQGVGLKGYLVPGCSGWSNSGGYQNTNTSFVSSDGMFWMLYSYSTTTGADMLAVDVNGEKGPNDWGKDVYIFVMDDIKLDPRMSCSVVHNDGSAIASDEFSAPLKN